jgi:hypothetical protein
MPLLKANSNCRNADQHHVALEAVLESVGERIRQAAVVVEQTVGDHERNIEFTARQLLRRRRVVV